ncbi:MAG: hypothetical protein CV087_09840 [Candidatus Brocadia sp. WS118]|nr:MAG: hypothetical protein CV087_09840 [Candidatus Brocadia sp. WS118]
MAKKPDFAQKGKKKGVLLCPVCGNAYSLVKKVESYYSETSKTWKYATQNIKVCQCNEKKIYS